MRVNLNEALGALPKAAVGTAHGIYTQEPHIHYDTIRSIATITTTPLVMHGATGVSDAAIQTSVAAGIRKINFFSDLLQSAMDEVRHTAGNQGNDYLAFRQRVEQVWRNLIEQQMRLFGTIPTGVSRMVAG